MVYGKGLDKMGQFLNCYESTVFEERREREVSCRFIHEIKSYLVSDNVNVFFHLDFSLSS